jgi:hypothetical protein
MDKEDRDARRAKENAMSIAEMFKAEKANVGSSFDMAFARQIARDSGFQVCLFFLRLDLLK